MFTRATAVVFALMLTAGISRPLAGASSSVPSDEAAVIHALNRLTFGIRAGDVARVKAMGLEKWIDLQLSPSRIDDKAMAVKLARLETLTLDSATIQRDYSGPAMVERRERKAEQGADQPDAMPMRDMPNGARGPVSETQRKDRQVMADIEEAKLLRAIYSERQLEEVLVDFWFNHFNVFAGKGATRNYLTEYEREAIRPYVLGNFRDMLEATAKSPAMLFYLDNWQNVAPQSAETGLRRRSGGFPARTRPGGPSPTSAGGASPRRGEAPTPTSGAAARPQRGINENYARELMELHTLGVDGGYTQDDIVNVARAFTGWTIKPREGSGTTFNARQHDEGEKKVLGQTIKGGGGEGDADRVLDILAAHPSTARFIATKLATRFVSDTPPKALVDRAAARFTATRGDLREVVRTIVTSPEFFAADNYRAKVKTPFEYVVSALRETGAEVRTALPLARELRDMGMPLYHCQPPTGYDDTATTWVSAGALVSRMNFAVALGKNELRGVRISNPPADLATTIGSPAFQRQ